MKLIFHGTLRELVDVLAQGGIIGAWEDEPNGVVMLRCDGGLSGANLHWARRGKTLWCDGQPAPRAELETRIAAIVDGEAIGDLGRCAKSVTAVEKRLIPGLGAAAMLTHHVG